MKEVLDFLNSIEGDGYGGMASFEIARGIVEDACFRAQRTSLADLAEQLREYTAMKYAGDCKCGKCQLVPRALVERIYHALTGHRRLPAACASCTELGDKLKHAEAALNHDFDELDECKAELSRLRVLVEGVVERCAKICDAVAINASRRAADHADPNSKAAALDKMEAAQLCAATIRERGSLSSTERTGQ